MTDRLRLLYWMKTSTTARTVLAVTVLASCFVAPAAHGRIVPAEMRVGKVKIYMTENRVRARLGDPDRVERIRRNSGRVVRRFVYRDEQLRVDRDRRSVDRIATRNRRERTDGGAGVGSTRAKVKRDAGDDVRCEPDRAEGDCFVYPGGAANDAPTQLVIRDGRVIEVRVVLRPVPPPDCHPPDVDRDGEVICSEP